MTIVSAPIPMACGIPDSIQEAIDALITAVDDNDNAEAPATCAAASAVSGRVVRANEVPVGGVFSWKGNYYHRTSGKGVKTGKDFMTTSVNKPCRGVRLSDGKVAGLNKAKVTYFEGAKVHLS